MHTFIFSALAAFFGAHCYRDYLHMKGVKDTLFTRIAHWWDAPQYEKHGMVVSFVLGSVFLWLAVT